MKLTKDKLLVFGLTEKEIAEVPNEDGVKKAKMILPSHSAGIVIKRSVGRGDSYESKDELMQVAPWTTSGCGVTSASSMPTRSRWARV